MTSLTKLFCLLLIISTASCDFSEVSVTYKLAHHITHEHVAIVPGIIPDLVGVMASCGESRPKEPFILLTQWVDCPILNASAMVYYGVNYTLLNHTVGMRASVIPILMLTSKQGYHLHTLVESGVEVMMHIGPFQDKQASFVFVSFTVLLIATLTGVVVYVVQRFRSSHIKFLRTTNLSTAATKALEQIPVTAVQSNEFDKADIEHCAICIEAFQNGDLIRTLPCQHSFHKNCIDPWLMEQRSCPMCKMDILNHFGLVYAGSEESVLEIGDNDSMMTDNDEDELILSREPSSVIVDTKPPEGFTRRLSRVDYELYFPD